MIACCWYDSEEERAPLPRRSSHHHGRVRAMTNEQTQTEIEAAAYRRLRDFLRDHPEVQNIDLMNLAGFCRNCLAKWYRAEAGERGVEIDYEQARERIYGMPYAEWRTRYQAEASTEQQAAYAARQEPGTKER